MEIEFSGKGRSQTSGETRNTSDERMVPEFAPDQILLGSTASRGTIRSCYVSIAAAWIPPLEQTPTKLYHTRGRQFLDVDAISKHPEIPPIQCIRIPL